MALYNEKLFDAIRNENLVVHDLTEIKKGVKFGDDIWDFTNDRNERTNSVPKSRLIFKWDEMKTLIGKRMVRDLKVLIYFLIIAPSLFGLNSNYKITTLHGKVTKICHIIKEIILKEQMRIGLNENYELFSFGDLTLNQFQEIKIPKSNVNDIKMVLKYMANSYIQKYFVKPVQWNMADIKNLYFLVLPKNTNQESSSKPLEEKLYIELIKLVTVDIVSFKSGMKMPIATTVTSELKEKLIVSQDIFDIDDAFNCYLEILEKDRLYSIKKGKSLHDSTTLRKKFTQRFGVNIQWFNTFLKNIQAASIMTILLFTGVRYSEIISLKKGCIQKRNDVYVMKGTVIKHRSENLPSDIDEWVAIPIVRDAIEVLECLQKVNNNSYLISSLKGVYLNQKDLPFSIVGLTKILNKYMERNSETNDVLKKYMLDFKANKITTHRFRHSLAQQLVRGKLGLPYISYHFKHINSAVVAYNRVSNVTLGYGGISKEIVNSAKSYQSAKKELFEQIYSPDAVVAGGGNAKEFMKRKTEYFQGLMVNDEEIVDIIEDLKDQSLPFLDVGLGYCGGRKDIELPDGSKQAPPCIGQLKCNPVDCGNAVIPKSKVPIWKKVYDDAIAKLNDESFAYMEVELKEIVGRAEKVLNHFR